MSAGRLIVCPTPIGNLEDITLRTLAALREADVIACEDTRTSKVLLDRYGVSAARVRYDSHAERRAAPRLVERMRAGETVALVSDAGMPLVSDPGLVLVQAAVAAGIAVEVLPGPSAALTALVASGMPAETWRFVGFLPRRKGELADLLRAEETLVAFESPRRAGATLAVLAGVDPDRPVALCRELTKLHEEIVRGSAAELAERYAQDGSPRRGGARDRPRGGGRRGPRGGDRRGAAPRRGGRAAAGCRRCRRGPHGRARERAVHGGRRRRFVTHRRRSAMRVRRPRRRAARGTARSLGACRTIVDMLLLPVIVMLLVTLTHAGVARAERWQRPLAQTSVAHEFDFDARMPFAGGAHRGVRLGGTAGEVVRAPCAGVVTFAGRVPRLGAGVSLRCGRLVATEFGLERPSVRRGAVVLPGTPVGRLGARGSLALGARVAGRRWGYRDPLTLLGERDRQRPLGPAPAPLRRGSRPRPALPRRWARAPRPASRPVPLAAWLGVGLSGVAGGLGTALRLRARRTRTARRARFIYGGDGRTH